MGMKDNNYYRLQHRQKGDTFCRPGIRIHRGDRGLDVEELIEVEQENYLASAADQPELFATLLRMICPKVHAAALNLSTPDHNALEEIRRLFVDGLDTRLIQG